MANKATTDAIQQDWKEREMIEVVHLNILKVSLYTHEKHSSSNCKYYFSFPPSTAAAVPYDIIHPRVQGTSFICYASHENPHLFRPWWW